MSETWEKFYSAADGQYGAIWYILGENGRYVAESTKEEHVDAIIADHLNARALGVAVRMLDEEHDHWGGRRNHPDPNCETCLFLAAHTALTPSNPDETQG